MLRPYQNILPQLAPGAYVDPQAVVVGDVAIGKDSSFWPGVVARGDVNRIAVGARTNIQDNSVLHVTHKGPYSTEGFPLIIGDEVTAGHRVILHGCHIHDRVLIGMGCIILDGVVVHSDVVIGAGSLVPEGKVLESGYLYFGSPAVVRRPLTEAEKEHIIYSANYYVKIKNNYL
ncbi:MAG: UDP-3-O-[3-hydroxymyristoyl] glucosamine N-acyltransferase [Gammaproteobacteria bacterium]|jgi:carbonic anhydrase/acetyltransferase-like protein (isoleucine patch superfamily)|nr:UDP-3-O-[3-hydroxymyristoyl] glucosamine N-acyltransferase [Gammaproteobacteria bacterium]